MAQLNKASLLTQLKTAAENATDTTVLAALTASLEKLSDDRIVALATVNDLQDLNTDPLPSGSVFFVDSIEVMVMAVGNKWLGLDGRLLRDDTPVVISQALTWANNNAGQLGDGTSVKKSSPVTVIGGINKWSQISAGSDHTTGRTSEGIGYAWGSNAAGQIGDGTTASKNSPVTIVGSITNWSQVDGGGSHSLGIAGGVAYAWGQGNNGQLGDGNTLNKSSPVTVIGGITNWSYVSAGGSHSLGIAGGVAYAWGNGSYGRLGDGTDVGKSSPVTVVGAITGWTQVSTGVRGYGHSLGIAGGVAYAWGYNFFGALGDGTTVTKNSPVTIIGGITNWSHVSAGGDHSLGIAGGVAYAWGRNHVGQLGNGTTGDDSSPISILGGITNWSSISAGYQHSLGVTSDGVAYGWGYNYDGRLGDGTEVDKLSPVTVIGGITSWALVGAGFRHSAGTKID